MSMPRGVIEILYRTREEFGRRQWEELISARILKMESYLPEIGRVRLGDVPMLRQFPQRLPWRTLEQMRRMSPHYSLDLRGIFFVLRNKLEYGEETYASESAHVPENHIYVIGLTSKHPRWYLINVTLLKEGDTLGESYINISVEGTFSIAKISERAGVTLEWVYDELLRAARFWKRTRDRLQYEAQMLFDKLVFDQKSVREFLRVSEKSPLEPADPTS